MQITKLVNEKGEVVTTGVGWQWTKKELLKIIKHLYKKIVAANLNQPVNPLKNRLYF